MNQANHGLTICWCQWPGVEDSSHWVISLAFLLARAGLPTNSLPTLESIKISFSWTQDVWCAPAGLHWLITSSHLNCSYSTLTAVHCCQYGINIIRRKRKPTVKFDYLLMNRELTNKWWENNESLIWQWHHLTSSASITTPDTDHQSWELVRICPSSGVWSRPPDESHCAVNQSTFHNQTFQTYLTLS